MLFYAFVCCREAELLGIHRLPPINVPQSTDKVTYTVSQKNDSVVNIIIHHGPIKKQDTKLLSKTLSNNDRFSKFFHHYT